jgi:L-fuculose-phosphate aldolase
MNPYLHPRDEILGTMQRIYRYRMTTTSGGNLSLREDDGSIWITPARLDKGTLRREDIVCVRPDGRVEGPHTPSSEFPFHQRIYAVRPDIRGIVHAHPSGLVAFSIARMLPEMRLFHQSWRLCGKLGLAPYALPGSEALADAIAAKFAEGLDAVVLENHGIVTGGEDFQTAFHRFETLEFAAKIGVKARALGLPRVLGEAQLQTAMQATVPGTFTRDAVSSEERELRAVLRDFVQRAYRQRLFISTQGSFSTRLDARSFLITPNRVDRGYLEARDLVLVRDGMAEAGTAPSRATSLHAAIYAAHPEIGALINAYPVNATAFAVTDAPFDTRTIPESYLLLRDVVRVPFGPQFAEHAPIVEALSPKRPVLLLENDGALVAGRSPLEAFDRLEVLEATAEALIDCRSVGPLVPIDAESARALDRHFFGE